MADGSYERRTFDLLERRGHAPERLDADALLARYPLLRPDAFSEGYANARAGWADSAAVTDEVVRQCRSRGVELRFGEPMSRLLQDGEGRVRGIATANGQQHRADRVVVAAGAWTPKLLPWLQEVMWPITQSVIHFRPDDPTRFRAPDFPTWVADGADGGWFGFPANDDGLVKVGSHGPGARLDPDDSRDVPGGEIDRCLAYLDGVLPELARMPIVASHRCLYCQTFDSYFWIARDPDREGLVVATGGSGRGFKFITHVGTWVADVIEGRESAVTHRFGWRAPVRIRPAST